MSKTVTPSYSSIVGVTNKTLTVPVFDFSTIFARSGKGEAGEVILLNKTSPISRPELARIASKKIADVYKGTGLAPSIQNPIKTGSQTLVGIQGAFEILDTETGVVDVSPYKVHTVITFQDRPEITNAMKTDVIMRHNGLLARSTGAAATDVTFDVNTIAMGGIIPSGV